MNTLFLQNTIVNIWGEPKKSKRHLMWDDCLTILSYSGFIISFGYDIKEPHKVCQVDIMGTKSKCVAWRMGYSIDISTVDEFKEYFKKALL